MANRTRFRCQVCGAESIRWHGRCPACQSWNTLEEVSGGTKVIQSDAAVAAPITEVPLEGARRLDGLGEFDRALGGGLVAGSTVLLGGEPGVGKSTLLLDIAARLADRGETVLYVSGEESVQQLRLRAERIGALRDQLLVQAEIDLETICAETERTKPALLVVDSIQTMITAGQVAAAGSVPQVREACGLLSQLARRQSCAVVIVGHVTKEGTLAGPKVLEHLVDVVLTLEGTEAGLKALRVQKNRYGPTHEVGFYEMSEDGLIEIPNPSEALIGHVRDARQGAAVLAGREGSRSFLVEVQALTAQAYGVPRRVAVGIDHSRLSLVAAILERAAGLRLSGSDIYVKVTAGLRLEEPSADLAVAIALASSHLGAVVQADLVVFGEIGLNGEVRGGGHTPGRLEEAVRLGFARALVPVAAAQKDPGPLGIEVIPVRTVGEAIRLALDFSGEP